MSEHQKSARPRIPWNKGKLIGQKAPPPIIDKRIPTQR
jgi:hypothetical protein